MSAEPAIHLDLASPVPPFEQVRQQIADLVAHGLLRSGDRLPPVRQLAGDLGLANGTVARAYQELEAAKLVVTRRGGGTRVAPTATPNPTARGSALAQQAHAYVIAGRRLGATDAELIEAVRTAQRTEQPQSVRA